MFAAASSRPITTYGRKKGRPQALGVTDTDVTPFGGLPQRKPKPARPRKLPAVPLPRSAAPSGSTVAPANVVPVAALTPEIRRVWQSRTAKPATAGTNRAWPTSASQQVEQLRRTPLAEVHTNVMAPKPKPKPRRPSPVVKKLSPVNKRAVQRTYGAAGRRMKTDIMFSSTEDESEDNGPKRATTSRSVPHRSVVVVDSTDDESVSSAASDMPVPGRTLRNLQRQPVVVDSPDGSPSKPIEISSDSDDDFIPSPVPQRAAKHRLSDKPKSAVPPPPSLRTSQTKITAPPASTTLTQEPKPTMRTEHAPAFMAAVALPELPHDWLKPARPKPKTKTSQPSPVKRRVFAAKAATPHRASMPRRKATPLPRRKLFSVVSTPSSSDLSFEALNNPVEKRARMATPRPQRQTGSVVSTPSSDGDLSLSFDEEKTMKPLARPPPSTSSSSVASEAASSPPSTPPTTPPRKTTASTIPPYVREIVHECGQDSLLSFDHFLSEFLYDDVHGSLGDCGLEYKKLGEASYSEVFSIGEHVLKVVPLRNPAFNFDGGEKEKEVPDVSEVEDVSREINMTREMGIVCSPGFVTLAKAFIVQGPYPEKLLTLWDTYASDVGSESIRPDGFPKDQTYAILVLPNLGTALETFTFRPTTGWSQACAIFWQVVRSLSNAEQKARFEHRDLHWGQILVQRMPVLKTPRTSKLDTEDFGVRATIIDLGLSRMQYNGDGEPHYTVFEDCIFEGEGDYQFDIYRMMQKHIKGDWRGFHPLTNVMWLHYLLAKLMKDKRLPKSPAAGREASCATSLLTVNKIIAASIKPTKGKGRAPNTLFQSAQDIAVWAEEREWL